MCVGFICLTLLAGLWVWYITYGKKINQVVPGNQADAVVQNRSQTKRVNHSEDEGAEPSVHSKGVAEVLTRYFKAQSWSERLPLLRKTPKIEEKMKSWYAWHQDEPFHRVAADRTMTEAGGFLVVKLHGEGLPSNHIVLEKVNGEYRIDWESFVVYQDLDWVKIQQEKSTTVREIRCILESAKNNHPYFTEEEGYFSYKLIHPVTKKVIISYYNPETSNQAHITLGQSLSPTAKGRYTLGVKYVEDADGVQDLVISKVLAKGWVLR